MAYTYNGKTYGQGETPYADIYAAEGDVAVADYMLANHRGLLTKGESNGANAVKAGKITFAELAADEKKSYDAAVSSAKANYGGNWAAATGTWVDGKSGHFGFAYNNPAKPASNPAPAATPSTPSPAQTSTSSSSTSEQATGSTEAKFPWQKAKEKAVAYKANSDSVNKWKQDDSSTNNNDSNDMSQRTFNKSTYKFDSSFTPWGKDK